MQDPESLQPSKQKAQTFLAELALASIILLGLKLWSKNNFAMISFIIVALPALTYNVVHLFIAAYKFTLSLMISPSVFTVHLAFYFAILQIAEQMDVSIELKTPIPIAPFILLIIVLGIQAWVNLSNLMGIGLTSMLSILTQSTTTVCAGGQCFQLGTQAITANLAAFGVTVTSVNYVLKPLCWSLLVYSVYSVYSIQKTCKNAAFVLSVVGALMIVIDYAIVGNIVLIGATVYGGRQQK